MKSALVVLCLCLTSCIRFGMTEVAGNEEMMSTEPAQLFGRSKFIVGKRNVLGMEFEVLRMFNVGIGGWFDKIDNPETPLRDK